MEDSPTVPRRQMGRRGAIGLLATVTAAAACTPAVVTTRPAVPPALPAAPPTAPPPAVEAMPVSAPPVTLAATPAEPSLAHLGAQRVVQPQWAGDGSRVLYYDQPAGGQGGTWCADPGSGECRLERPQWGYYVAQSTIVATPRPSRRDTYVQHVPTGREWTLPSAGFTVFSADGTLVAYNAGGTVVAGADNQFARRVQLPINGSVLAWAPGADGSGRLLLSGRRSPGDDPGLWSYGPGDRRLVALGRSKRLTGVLPSRDGEWVAYVAMWNPDPAQNGVWVARTDGSLQRRLSVTGSYRWAADNRLFMVPVRASAADAHQLWEALPETGAVRRVLDGTEIPFRVANHDWDISPDGTQLAIVSADDKALWHGAVPATLPRVEAAPLPELPAPPSGPRAGGKSYRLPFATPPGPSTWYVGQWYGVTTGGYRWRNSTYVQGQGIHFGVDFACPFGTEVVAIAPGKVVAVDGDYGSPPHNVVLQLFDGNVAVYGHLRERTTHVEVGQSVEPGQVLGNSGDSLFPYDGSKNPHLHLEIRKQGRAVATNPVPYFDANWDDLTLGVWQAALFERDLDNPRQYQFLDEQPDIRFGGPIITNFARAWPV